MDKFKLERVVITGAGSGLGQALAIEFAKLGWKVAIIDIDMERANQIASIVTSKNGLGLPIQCDVSKKKSLEKAFKLVIEKWNGADILINNVGIPAAGKIEKIPFKDWHNIININFIPAVYGCKVFVPLMAEQGGGHIVNTSSFAGIVPMKEFSMYNVTKSAVISLSETLKLELASKNIGVTVIAPTFFRTNLMERFTCTDEHQRKMADAFLCKSNISSEYIAKLALKAIMRNKLYVIEPLPGKIFWLIKRLFPEALFKLLSIASQKNWIEKYYLRIST
jgi:short-subunit dehydrogenase